MLGDYLSTGLGVLGLSWQASPALTELEEVMTDWMRQMVGLSPAWSGVIQDTASTSTLVALICARERASGYALAKGGLQGGGPPLTVYVSAHSHSSVEKAALLAGFGREYVRAIEVDRTHYAVRPDALRAAIRGRPRQRPEAVRHRGHERHHDFDRFRSAGGARRAGASSTAPGCTWTRRWRARR